jgi:nicotinamidase/pyrazinamidase
MLQEYPTVVILTDVQADFTQWRNGALAVPGTGQGYVLQVIEATRGYKAQGFGIVATRDYHPADHLSFYTNHPGQKAFDRVLLGGREQVLWPPHCVQATPGVDILVPAESIDVTVSKGTRKDFDSYSAFRDDGGLETGLKDLLHEMKAQSVIVYGLATDYCIRATVLHALEERYPTTVRADLCRGITPEGARSALEEMRVRGAIIQD